MSVQYWSGERRRAERPRFFFILHVTLHRSRRLEVMTMPIRAALLERLKQKLMVKRRELLSGVREQHANSLESGSDGIQDIADQATNSYTKEFLLSIGDAERQLLKQVDAALEKIRLKKYGLCDRCGEKIGEKRLEALPFARLCIACQQEEEERRT